MQNKKTTFLKNFILDIIFPKKCLQCQKIDSFLCLDCFSKIKLKEKQFCPYCEKNITFQGEPCKKCQSTSKKYLDNLIVACHYQDPLKKTIHLFKYNFIEDLGQPLANLLFQSFLKNNLTLPDIIIPVPLHKLRKRWRGFNQSEILAKKLASLLTPGIKLRIFNDLQKIRFTASQMKVKKYQQRKSNLKKAFQLKNENEIKGKNVLLIDDIATTGTTLTECAKILKKGKAKKVFALILARQEIPS